MVNPAARLVYEIRVRGVLGGAFLGAFPALRGVAQGGDTVLTGVLADQAALHGVLSQIESLGLELIALHQVSPPTRSPRAADERHEASAQPATEIAAGRRTGHLR